MAFVLMVHELIISIYSAIICINNRKLDGQATSNVVWTEDTRNKHDKAIIY